MNTTEHTPAGRDAVALLTDETPPNVRWKTLEVIYGPTGEKLIWKYKYEPRNRFWVWQDESGYERIWRGTFDSLVGHLEGYFESYNVKPVSGRFGNRDALAASHARLVKVLSDIAGDGICMRGFYEEFRHEIQSALAAARNLTGEGREG